MKRYLILVLVMLLLTNTLLPTISMSVGAEAYEPVTTVGSDAALYTSGNRFAVVNDTVYAIDANGLYRYHSGQKQTLCSIQIDVSKGFCTNGAYAYFAAMNGALIRIDIFSAKTEQLFFVSDLEKIAGATQNGVYLGRTASGSVDWWGCDLYFYDFYGHAQELLASGVEVYMDQGFLIYKNFRSDVSPTYCTAIDSDGNIVFQNRWIISTQPIVIAGKIYYLDISNYKNQRTVELLACTAQEQVEIASFYVPSQYEYPETLSMYFGAIQIRNQDGTVKVYHVLTGEQLPLSSEDANKYSLLLDEKTYEYFAMEYTWSSYSESSGFYSLSDNGNLEKCAEYTGSLLPEKVYDSYVYGYNFDSGELICISLRATPQEIAPQPEALPDSIPEAVKILVENREVWMLQPEWEPMYGYEYGMLDFDGDGIPELYATSCDGSLQLSGNHFYKIDLESRTVTQIDEVTTEDFFSDYDLSGTILGYQKKTTGKIYYLCYDYTHVSSTEQYKSYGFLSLSGGALERTALWGIDAIEETISYDFMGQSVADEATWQAKQEAFLEDYTKLDISFLKADGQDADASSDKELAFTLTEIYDAFYSNVSFAPIQNDGQTSSSNEQADFKTVSTFNEYFVKNKADNILAMQQYDSVAYGICKDEGSFDILWNQFVQAFTNTEYIDPKTLTAHPEAYYEIVLIEAIMEKQLSDDYYEALLSEIMTATMSFADFFVSYSPNMDSNKDLLEQKLKDTLGDFGRSSTEYKKLESYYKTYCDALADYETVKFIYDSVVEIDGTTSDFYERLSQYASLKNATDDIISALEFTRDRLQHSTRKEEQNIVLAIEHVLQNYQSSYWEKVLLEFDTQLQHRMRTIIWSLLEGSLFSVKLGAAMKDLIVNTSTTLSDVLFPVSMSSEGFCKIYAAYAMECVFKTAMADAYQAYLQTPTKEYANITVGLYDLLYKVCQHQIRVAEVLSEQLHIDGLLNGLRNFFFDGNLNRYNFEKDCIRAYQAYLNEIIKVKVEAQAEYDLAIGKNQPVTIVCFVNGKVLHFYSDTVETGTAYRLPVEKLELASIFGMEAELTGAYTDEAMTMVYDETSKAQAPLTIYCNVILTLKTTGEQVILDGTTGIFVSRSTLSANTRLTTQAISTGEEYDTACAVLGGVYLEMYDISLRSGNSEVQPSGEITVSIPAAEAYTNANVYRKEADGSWTNMHASKVGDAYQFTTTHFSRYAVVYEKETKEVDSRTGLILTFGVSIVILGAIVCWLLLLIRKRQKEQR